MPVAKTPAFFNKFLGVATYTTVTLSGGYHSLAAVYGGDANYQ